MLKVFKSLTVAFGLAINFTSISYAVAGNSEERYFAIDKSIDQLAGGALLEQLNQLTTGQPRLLYLMNSLRPSDSLRRLANAVVRIDLLYRQPDGSLSDDTCTGTAISTDLLVTAAHCVPGSINSGKTLVRARAVAGYETYNNHNNVRIAEISTAPVIVNPQMDISIIRLRESLTGKIQPFALNVRDPIPGETVAIISHPLGQSKRLSSGRCVIENKSPLIQGQFTHLCATFGGSSGAIVVSATDFAVVGVHIKGLERSNIANSMVRMFYPPPPIGIPNVAKIVSPPFDVNRSGYTVPENVLREAFIDAVRRQVAVDWINTMFLERVSIREIDRRNSLAEITVLSGDRQALNALAKNGVRLNGERGEQILAELVDRANNREIKDPGIIRDVLLLGAVPIYSASTGALIFCGPDTISDVRRIFAEMGYEQNRCLD
ncbi:trypsin-like serine peptidase [Skermanella stibiiresistens]|uniref:trypsin-like serine peptidase n=1 Tax=Skermanella stibiiresistens TaxID=913326 RepID=UPI0004AC862C|nr:serine protease [Skermanella stibiiresistens]